MVPQRFLSKCRPTSVSLYLVIWIGGLDIRGDLPFILYENQGLKSKSNPKFGDTLLWADTHALKTRGVLGDRGSLLKVFP